jgi:cell wall-associated NlpC family hydrolase
MAALAELGKPYRYATSDPAVGFDCSGLTAYAWSRAGVDIANQSGAQIRAAAPRDHATAMAGDLAQYPGHVMMYLGVGDAIVHAVNRSDDVELDFVRRNVKFGNPIG